MKLSTELPHSHELMLLMLGLDCKVLKNVLKKEKCYNTVMTTANLQAVQGTRFYVKVIFDPDHCEPMVSPVKAAACCVDGGLICRCYHSLSLLPQHFKN